MTTPEPARDPDVLVNALLAAFVKLNPEDQRLAVDVYRSLLQGRPATIDALASRGGLNLDEVKARLHEWFGVFFDDDDRVVGFWGVSVDKMDHRVEMDGNTSWAWCALDPLFIIPLVDGVASVTSSCPITEKVVSLKVARNALLHVSPPGAVVSFLSPSKPFDADVYVNFCHFVRYFASPEAGKQWVANHPDTFVVPIEEAAEVGRRIAAAVFPTPWASNSL